MSSIYRIQWTKPLPASATIRTKGARRVAEWTSRGKTHRGEVVGNRVRIESLTYWARWKDADGRLHRADTECRDGTKRLIGVEVAKEQTEERQNDCGS